MELVEVLFHKEDQAFDFKSIQVVPKVLVITIVAFATAGGCYLHWGV